MSKFTYQQTEWYTCGQFGNNNIQLETICCGPFPTARQADIYTDKLKLHYQQGHVAPNYTKLIPVSILMPECIKQPLIQYKMHNTLHHNNKFTFCNEVL